MRLTTTRRTPSATSGTQTPFYMFVIRLASPPFIEAINLCAQFVGCRRHPAEKRKATDFPSGLQRGELEDCGEVVNCQGARLPSLAAIQIDEVRRFWARSIFVTT